ncbi:DUF4157 domain-containing protein [Streptomyces sp. 8P21H-1]|uniref:eCIS core domain-containing protein n=1 Tax=Streptomyces sp. 8P21H-1 TaxID=2737048 RepID=UPI0020C613DF|nr:DUF4157 domain-containing protein [Streptomyces sp. 8P21H-1]
MRAHDEQPEGKTGSRVPGARRTPSLPGARRTPPLTGGPGGGPMTPARLAALQGSVGNRVVARLVEKARHVHGAGCGHLDADAGAEISADIGKDANTDRSGDGEPVVQRALLDAAMASPSRPLPDGLRKEAESFYRNDLSSTRIHDNDVAQRATAALGARAMTVGSHIFLPPSVAGDKSVVGHELSHVSSNLAGVRETGTTSDAGVTVTDPRQDSEQQAETDGTAFAAGAGRAPSTGRRASRTGGGGGGDAGRGPVVARMEKGTPSVRGKATAGGQFPGRDEIIAEVDKLAKACTCKQNKKQWGRITKEVVIRYARDYENDREGQSLRHLTRQMLAAIADEERKARDGGTTPTAGAKKAGAGKAEAGRTGKKKTAEPVKEQEIQAMLVNGHLVFASNYNQSMHRLFDLLRELSGGLGEDDDLGGADTLQKLMGTDFGSTRDEVESGGSDTESESEAEVEAGADAAASVRSRGKRPAGAQQTDRAKGGKRRRTEPEEETGAAAPGARAQKSQERKRRDHQALLKIREGLTPRTQRLEPLGTDAMDLDEPEGGTGGFKRDNATLKALREASRIRLVDVSNEASQEPGHRRHLAALLAKDGEYSGYAYLVHNGVGAGKMHAEQKLLQLLQNAEFTGATEHDPIHIRGPKRPCDACLAMLRYFREKLELNLVYNPRGNHYFRESVESGFKNLTGHDGARSGEFADHMRESMGDDQRVMYESTARHVVPAPAGDGLGEAVAGAQGGLEQRYTVPVKGTDKSGETVRELPPGGDIQGVVDTPSNSEAEEEGEAMSTLVSHTSHLRLGTRAGAQAPDTRELKADRLARERAEFAAEVEPKLIAAAGPAFWAEVDARTDEGGKFTLAWPDALRRQIKELSDGNAPLRIQIAKRLKMSTISLDKQLAQLTGPSRKLRLRLAQVEGATERLEAAMPADMRRRWEAQKAENARTGTEKKLSAKDMVFTPQFEAVLHELIHTQQQRVSANSIAEHLLMPLNTFRSRAENIEKKYAAQGASQ